jgi:hypothetical protein
MVMTNQQTWQQVRQRISNKVTNVDFKTLCKLHAETFKHKYLEPCTCNKAKIRDWIDELDNELL